MPKTILLFLISFLPTIIFAQYNLSGIILDNTGESLAFVNVIINEDDGYGVIADVDGRFEIETKEEINILTFSYVGYETLHYEVTENDRAGERINVVLEASDFGLGEVVVLAGENPAHRIIKKAVKNKRKNNHERLSSYQCEIYTKMKLTNHLTDSVGYAKAIEAETEKNKKKSTKSAISNTFDTHLFIAEAVTERKFQFPETVRNKLLHNRVSGMKKMDLSTMNAYQQFGFYDDFVSFAGEAYVNPISKGSTKLYFFNIEDTLYQASDTIFIVSYKRRKNKVFEAMKGVVYINTSNYAIQNILAEPADADGLLWKLEHKYIQLPDGTWFPEQMNFELIIPDLNADYSDSRLTKKSYISNVIVNKDFTLKEMKDDFRALEGEIISRDDAVWEEHRREPLSAKDQRSYEMIDSLGDKMKLDAIMNISLSFITGNLEVKGVDLKWKNFLRLNDYEKVRLGVGLQTNKNFSRYISVGGYFGYGFKDKRIKYGGNVTIDIIPDDILEIKYAYFNEIAEPGLFKFPLQDEIFIGRGIFAEIMDAEVKHAVSLQSRYKFLRSNITFEKSELTPLYTYGYNGSDISQAPSFNFSELTFNLRYAFGEKNNWFMGVRMPSQTKYPILLVGYTKGFDNLLGGEFDYHKISLAVQQHFNARFLGETRYRVEAGMIKNDVPYSKLFIASGPESLISIVNADYTFQAMRHYEFASDKFVNVFLEHDFGNILVRKKYSRPRLIILHNMGFGTLEKSELHDAVNVATLEKGYFESGVGLDNLIVLPVLRSIKLGFGIRAYYRYGSYQLDELKDNFAVRWNMKVVF
jgi:hypothetical protein